MNNIKSLLGTLPLRPQQTKIRNERDEIFEFFFSKLREPYFQFTKRHLTKRFLAIKLSHLKKTDLYAFKSMCIDAERRGYPFSKFFWGNLKVKPENWQY